MSVTLTFEDAYYDSGYIYFFAYEVNGIFRINLPDNSMEFLVSIKEYGKERRRLFGSVVCIDKKLYFAPLSADDILIYDMVENDYRLISIDKEDYKGTDAKFYALCQYQNSLFFFPTHYPAILKLDLLSGNIMYYKNWLGLLPDYYKNGMDYFRQSVCLRGELIIAPLCYSDDILLFDLKNNKEELVHIATERDKEYGFSGIRSDVDGYWLSSLTGKELYKWDYQSSTIKKYLLDNKNKSQEYSYVGLDYCGDKVIIRPAYENDLVIFDCNNICFEKISSDEYRGYGEGNQGASTVRALIKCGGKEFFLCPQNGKTYYKLVLVNDKTLITECKVEFDRAIESWRIAESLVNEHLVFENDFMNINAFINSLNGEK